MSAALRELDDLKRLLENQTAHLGSSRRRPSSTYSSPRSSAIREGIVSRSMDGGVNGYTSMLSHTEVRRCVAVGQGVGALPCSARAGRQEYSVQLLHQYLRTV